MAPTTLGTQGNRISDLEDELSEEFVAPSCFFEFASPGDFCGFPGDDVQGDVAQDGEVFGAIVEAVSGFVLVHGHVEHPMEAVLDSPVCPRNLSEARRVHGRAEQVAVSVEVFLPNSRCRVILPMAARPGHAWMSCNQPIS